MTNPVNDWKNSRRADTAADLDGVEAVTAETVVRPEMEARYIDRHLDESAIAESGLEADTSVGDAEYMAAEEWGHDVAAFYGPVAEDGADHGL